MVKKKLKFIFILFFTIFSNSVLSNPNLDQWLDTEKSYKDLINEGFEVKSYSISNIETTNGLLFKKKMIYMNAKSIKQWIKI